MAASEARTRASTYVERVVDLDQAGIDLPVLIEAAAWNGERLILERRGERLATVEPDPRLREPFGPATRGEAHALLERMSQGFGDQSEEDVARETARALAEARADLRTGSAADRNGP